MSASRAAHFALLVFVCAATPPSTLGAEVTVQNDSATDGSQATPCLCFIPDDEAAAWLTSTCEGDIVAVQVYWRSMFGGQPDAIEHSISIYAPGTFPNVGGVLQNAIRQRRQRIPAPRSVRPHPSNTPECPGLHGRNFRRLAEVPQ